MHELVSHSERKDTAFLGNMQIILTFVSKKNLSKLLPTEILL